MPNDYATANLAFLQQSFPDLYLRLQANDFPAAALVPELQPSRQGSATLAVQAQGRTVYLHSRHDPLTEAARWAEAQRSSTGGVVLFLGWGLGYPVLEWCRRYGRQAPAVIVWEPEPAFFAASLSQVDLQPLQSLARLEIVLGADEPALYRALHRHLSLLLSHELLIKPLPFVALYPPATVASLKHQVQTIAHLQRNALRHMELMGQTIQRHLLANLRHAPDCRLPHELAGIAASQPGILVAAGPSLDKNVHHLRQAEGKAWIFAVDTSLRILQHRGIRADIVVTKDPTELNTAHFQGMENLQTPMLAFEPQVHPEIPQRFIGEKIWLPGRTHQLHYHLRTFELRQADDFPHSTNVALAAFNLAARMGCDPIIFVGLDLCFSEPGGASHAAAAALRANVRLDSPHGRLSYRRGDRQDEVEVVWVEGVDGNPYPSTSHFLEALRLLETLIHRQHALCIDATEGGARIAGTQLLPLQQALENFCRSEIAPSAVLRRCPRLRRSASLRQSVLAIAEYLESCDRLASEALALLETDADLSPDRLRTLDDYRGRIEQGQKLYQVLENSLERLIVEIDRPGFWDDPTIPPAERTRRYVWYFSQVHLAAQTGAALYLQAAEALAVDEEGSLPGGSELGKISPKT